MNYRTRIWLGWTAWLLALMVQLGAFILAFLVKGEGTNYTDGLFLRISTYLPGLFAFATVGLIVITRRPANTLGGSFSESASFRQSDYLRNPTRGTFLSRSPARCLLLLSCCGYRPCSSLP